MIKIPSEIRLKEKLIDITEFNDYKLVSEREELQDVFNKTLRELYKESNEFGCNYKYAFGMDERILDLTLKNFLNILLHNLSGTIKFYISKYNEVEGLIFYTIAGTDFTRYWKRYAEDICVLSFNLKKNSIVLIKDLYALVKDLRTKYKEINWSADVNNPATKNYKSITEHLGGFWKESTEYEEVLEFKIPGIKGFKEPINEQSEQTGEKEIFLELKERRLFSDFLVNDLLSKHLVEYYLDKKKKSDRLIDGYSNFLEQIGVET